VKRKHASQPALTIHFGNANNPGPAYTEFPSVRKAVLRLINETQGSHKIAYWAHNLGRYIEYLQHYRPC